MTQPVSDPSVSDILAIVSLLVTILTFLFNLGWSSIDACLNANNPAKEKKIERKKARDNIYECLLKIITPTFIGLLCLFYVNLPMFCNKITNSSLSLWHFNVTDTLFCLMELSLLLFMFFLAVIIYRLFNKLNQLK